VPVCRGLNAKFDSRSSSFSCKRYRERQVSVYEEAPGFRLAPSFKRYDFSRSIRVILYRPTLELGIVIGVVNRGLGGLRAGA